MKRILKIALAAVQASFERGLSQEMYRVHEDNFENVCAGAKEDHYLRV